MIATRRESSEGKRGGDRVKGVLDVGTGISRREFVRVGSLAVASLSLGPLLAACQSSTDSTTLEQARRQGFIRVGFANEVPYGYLSDSGKPTGAAPEVAAEVMRRLGVPALDGVVVSFGSLITGLREERFDVIAAGMFITPERCQEVLFSDPVFCVSQAFVVGVGNPFGIRRYEDVAGNPDLRLGVLTGGVEETQAAESGIPAGQIDRFDDPEDLIQALRAGRITAGAVTTVSAEHLALASDLSGLEVTEGFAYRGELGCGAFAFRKSDGALRDDFDQVLREIRSSGRLTEIAGQFGFASAAPAAEGLSAEELCAG